MVMRCFRLAWMLAALGVLGLAGQLAGRKVLENWTRSAGFQELMSREVSRAMKVDGSFGSISVEGWEARVPDYQSTGWPGEAISVLEAEGIEALFNPWGIFRRVWQVDRIQIARGRFELRLPNDALKRPPVRGRKPWYAMLMPKRFFCPEIVCLDAGWSSLSRDKRRGWCI